MHSRALLSSLLMIASTSGFAKDASDKAFEDAAEKTRVAIFAAAPTRQACLEVSRHPKGKSSVYDKTLVKLLTDVTQGFRSGDATLIERHLHPRVAAGGTALEMTLSAANMLGKPIDASVARVWALNGVEDPKTALGSPLPCADEPVSIVPIHGYNLQFGAWIDLLGPAELGRALVVIVPSSGSWRVGHMHLQRWTTNGRDFNALADEARQDAAKSPLAAWIKLDVTGKLLSGSRHFVWNLQSEATRLRDSLGSSEQFLQDIAARVPGKTLVFAGSVLTASGPGLLLRIRYPKDARAETTRRGCWETGTALAKDAWFKRLAGLKCDFVMEGDPVDREGPLGGIYLTRADLAKPFKGK